MVLGFLRNTAGNIAGNLDQDAFVAGAENESKLQALQRANQNRINRDFFIEQQGGPPAIPAPVALNQGSAGLKLDGFGGNYINVPPPVVEKKPEVVAPEVLTPPGQDDGGDPFFNDQEGDGTGEDQRGLDTAPPVVNELTFPNFDPEKELDFGKIGQSGVTDITQVDPESSAFAQDIQKLFADSEFGALFRRLGDRAATGYGDKLAGSPAGRIYGYFFDNPKEAKERSKSVEASNWYRTDEAKNYFLQNPNQLTAAAVDPTGWYNKFKEEKPQREKIQKEIKINKNSAGLADKRIDELTNDKTLLSAFGNAKVKNVRNVAGVIGFDPDFATAIMGIESSFGATTATSGKGAKGIMQVMPDTFNQMKAWYSDPANITKYNIPANVVALAKNMRKGSATDPTAGLLYLKYGEYIGVPKNLLAAGYQGGMESVLKRGTPTTANDGSLTNTDYNRTVISVYNKIIGITGGTTTTTTDSKPFQGTSSANNVTTTTTTNNQIAGLTTDVQTDTDAKSANTGNTGTASGDVSSLKDVGQAGVDDGTTTKKPEEVVPESKTEVKPPAFYTKDPSQTGFELRNFLEERELIINQTNRNVQILAQRSDYFRRLAEVSRIGGTDEKSYNSLMSQSTELMAKAQTMQQAGALEAKKSENKIMYLQGMQALSDLTKGSTNRAAMVWSQYSGMDIRINPRSDGKYDITVGGKPYKTLDSKQLSTTLQLAFDQGYRGSQASLASEMAMKSFENQLEIAKQQYKDLGENYRARLNAQFDFLKEKYKADTKVTVTNTGDGGVIIQEGSQTFMLVEQETVGPNGEKVYNYIKQRVTTPSGINSYKRDKKE